ncbi:hypothetical protein [Pectobacterium parmentieri]|uniref:hypothetical protein n=1 Tax=Pectobacterium parmentieri TaxID=1905730 RepID=UPI0018E123FC|nr:hypothetical protein [Pectobacterium parmentieri]QQA75784.1 hypothetical protein JBL47_21400 [Pectobacterium parmentieri]
MHSFLYATARRPAGLPAPTGPRLSTLKAAGWKSVVYRRDASCRDGGAGQDYY